MSTEFEYPLVAIHATPGGVRVSKITPHGEELLEPDLEGKILCVLAWQKVAKNSPGFHTAVFPDLERLVKDLRVYCGRLEKLESRISELIESAEKAASNLRNETPARPPRGQ